MLILFQCHWKELSLRIWLSETVLTLKITWTWHYWFFGQKTNGKFSWEVSLCDCQKRWLLCLGRKVDVDVLILPQDLSKLIKSIFLHWQSIRRQCVMWTWSLMVMDVEKIITQLCTSPPAKSSVLASFNSLFWFLWSTSLWFWFSLTAFVSLVFIWSSQISQILVEEQNRTKRGMNVAVALL